MKKLSEILNKVIYFLSFSAVVAVFSTGAYWLFWGKADNDRTISQKDMQIMDLRIENLKRPSPPSPEVVALTDSANNLEKKIIRVIAVSEARKEMLLSLQYRHRFEDMNEHDQIICYNNDLDMRDHMLNEWRDSFEHLHDLVSWPFLDKLYRSFSSARVIPIMAADTLGYVSETQPSQLSILALEKSEYTIPNGIDKAAAAYYSHDQNLIVFRYNYKSGFVVYSYENARTVFHELCHYYLRRYGWSDKKEHAWIKVKDGELLSRLTDIYCVSADSAVSIFEEFAFQTYPQPDVNDLPFRQRDSIANSE